MVRYFNMTVVIACALMMTMSSCTGYRWGAPGTLAASHKTICVPYAEGDKNGALTSALVHSLESYSGGLVYVQDGGQLVLHVALKDAHAENIGFRHTKDSENRSLNDVIQVESRMFSKAEISVEDSLTGNIVVGPVTLVAHVDYDYDIDSARSDLLDFSIGQMTTNENAGDAVGDSLSRALAATIVSYINHIW